MNRSPGKGDLHALFGYLYGLSLVAGERLRRLADERGQGTVEYVGRILLVSMLMVGMVVAMCGFNESRA